MKTIAFFNNKGGVGKTSLVYHLAWMFADNDIKTTAVDLDPQGNLTAMYLNEERLESLWYDGDHSDTVYGVVRPILRGLGDIADPHIEYITDNLGLMPGDLNLSRFEDKLSDAWLRCHNRDESAFRTMTAFHHLIQKGEQYGAQLALIDVGPNLGAINRSALIASDYVVIPLAPDLFSIQGLKNSGPALREWRSAWSELLNKVPQNLPVPGGRMNPLGYVILQHSIRDSRPYQRWMRRIPQVYGTAVLDEPNLEPQKAGDKHCLSLLKYYRSLMVMAMEYRKPMFFLKPADGAIGSHVEAVRACYNDFKILARNIAKSVGLDFPS